MRKTFLIAATPLFAALTLTAMPAQAHGTGDQYQRAGYEQRYDADRRTPLRNANIRADIAGLQRDIDRAERRGTISHREARYLTREARDLQVLHARYARGGITAYELRHLESGVTKVRIALRQERRDRDGRRG